MEVFVQSAFGEIAALMMIAAVIGSIGILLRQPLIVSFIAVGLVAGPSVLDMVQSDAQNQPAVAAWYCHLVVSGGHQTRRQVNSVIGASLAHDGLRTSGFYSRFWIPDRAGPGFGSNHQSLCGSGADVFFDHHHREAVVR